MGGVTNIGNSPERPQPGGAGNIQQAITSTFGPGAGQAFATLIPLIQTVTGIFGQIVDLGVNHMKPLIEEIFTFLTGTLFPAVVPLLQTVIGLVGTTLVNAVAVIVDVVKAVLPAIEPIITGIIGLIQGIANVAVSVVNFVIRGLNNISITMPDWLKYVPFASELAGKTLDLSCKRYLCRSSPTAALLQGRPSRAKTALKQSSRTTRPSGAGLSPSGCRPVPSSD